MDKKLCLSKIKALSIHFCISLLIFLILLFFILFQWYPPPFFSTDGGWQGIRLIAFVDLILGPTLTFVIFNPGKARKLLIMDLSVIGLCQVLALAWGIWAVHNERPYFAVFADGAFYTLPFYQVKETGLNKTDIAKFDSGNTPIKIYVDIPADKAKYFALLTKAVKTKPFEFMGDLYRPFDHDNVKRAARYSINMPAYLKGESAVWGRRYRDFASSIQDTSNILFFSLHGRYGKYIVAFDRKALAFRKVLDIPPPSIDEIVWGKQKAKKLHQLNKQRHHQQIAH